MKRRFGSFFYKPNAPANDVAYVRAPSRSLVGGFLKKLCFGIGAVVLFSVVMGILAGVFIGGSPNLPEEMIVELNIDDPIVEVANAPSISNPTAAGGLTVKDVVDFFDHAARDARVKGVILNLNNAQMELAHIQEIRGAVKRFRSAKKPAYIYTASFGDLGSGIGAYYLATAFDEIWMQPMGFVSITGISAEMPFARNVLDKVGVTPDFLHREEYKSAMESFTNSKMSDANREMMTSLITSMSGQVFEEIALDRGIKNDDLKAYINKGFLTGKEAAAAGLITKTDADTGMAGLMDMTDTVDILRHEMYIDTRIQGGKTGVEEGRTKAEIADDIENMMVDAYDYMDDVMTAAAPKKAPVALVTISGEIIPGSDYETGYATGDYIAQAIRDAAKDPNIKVIVVRVDSPGGSPSASETIRTAIVNAKKDGKKVLVSMGPLAASGGYWLSVDADRIFALPSTLTGSIGVIMGKFELSGLWEKLGVTWDGASWGENSGMWSMNKPLSASERAVLNTAIDDTYDSFLTRVAEGRKMKKEDVREIAKGRAWTGLQAMQNGLVDEIGDLDSTLDYAAKIVGVKDKSKMGVMILPEPMSTLDIIMSLMGTRASVADFETQLPPSMMKTIVPMIKHAQVSERMGPVQAYDPRLSGIRY